MVSTATTDKPPVAGVPPLVCESPSGSVTPTWLSNADTNVPTAPVGAAVDKVLVEPSVAAPAPRMGELSRSTTLTVSVLLVTTAPVVYDTVTVRAGKFGIGLVSTNFTPRRAVCQSAAVGVWPATAVIVSTPVVALKLPCKVAPRSVFATPSTSSPVRNPAVIASATLSGAEPTVSVLFNATALVAGAMSFGLVKVTVLVAGVMLIVATTALLLSAPPVPRLKPGELVWPGAVA